MMALSKVQMLASSFQEEDEEGMFTQAKVTELDKSHPSFALW